MSFHPTHLRELITNTLRRLAVKAGMPVLYSADAVELLMMTAAQETLLGMYLKQIKGPAMGIFQIEPATHSDLYSNYLVNHPQLKDAVDEFYATGGGFEENMTGNLLYQIAIARAFYYRVPKALPPHTDADAMARYYKKYWNTYLGKATIEEAKTRYAKYAF